MKSNIDLALLLVRVGLALVFIAHGWEKISTMDDVVVYFTTKLEISAFWAYLVAYVELIGGISMLIGVFTGWSGVLLAATMVGAIAMVKLTKGFIGGYEFDLMLFLSAIAISLAGPGHYTIMRYFKR
jgi:putative oxidoreductase